jgi:hypothetical protein|tara:strand:+ start:302 stop:1174 length:873 start_codon:yes stop_codon:yes gene_type:complete
MNLSERVKDFTIDNTYHLSNITDDNDFKHTIIFKEENSNYVFNFPYCPHHGQNITFELESGLVICTCGCFECVSERDFTWGCSTIPDTTCLDFEDHKDTIKSTCGQDNIIDGVFPCNSSVDGRELTNEELIAKIINRFEWKNIHDKMNPNNWFLKTIKVIKNNIPDWCNLTLMNLIGYDKYEKTYDFNNYYLTQNDIFHIYQCAQRSVNGILPPNINFRSNDILLEWERIKVKEANSLFLSENLKEVIDVIDPKKKICIDLFNKVDEIKNNISLISYIKILEDIKKLYEL